jgi:hypothetical protein
MSSENIISYLEWNIGNFSFVRAVHPLVISVQKVRSKSVFGCCLCGRGFELKHMFDLSDFDHIYTDNKKSVACQNRTILNSGIHIV